MYCAHFGLTQAPFALTPNTAFFCELPTHREALNTVLVALSQGEGLIVVTGEVGSGKTLLCRLLLNHLHGRRPYAYIANAHLDPEGLRRALATELGVAHDDPAQLQGRIERQLLALNAHGASVVWVIDEAQALSRDALEALRLFSNLETEQRKLLQIVLFAQPELQQRLAKPDLRQLRQRIAFSYRLRTLRRDESAQYLRHRLRIAGHADGQVFAALTLAGLHFFSHGIPRVLNLLTHKALMLAFARQDRRIRSRDVWRAALDTDSTAPSLQRLTGAAFALSGLIGLGIWGAVQWWPA